MPAGGGAAGGGCGGGGGGGGFGGGGGGFGGGGGGAYYHPNGACGGASPLTCKQNMIVAVVTTVGLLILLGLGMGIPFGLLIGRDRGRCNSGDAAVEVPVFFSPGDTRIVPFGSFFCDEVTLVDKGSTTGSTLYLITDTPPLTDQNSFTINSSLTLTSNNYNYWNYYLYPGSNFTTTVRTRDSLSRPARGRFYLFKGRSSFQQWIKNPCSNQDSAIATFSISRPSSGTSFYHKFTFLVQDEDEYYFVYYSSRDQSTVLRLDVAIYVNRFQYSISDLTTAASCSAIGGQCSLNVPPDSNYRALIVTDIPDNPDWEENVDVSLICSSNREWAYVVVVLIPILVIAVGCIAATILGCVCWRSCRHHAAVSHRHQPSQTTASSVQLLRITELGTHSGPKYTARLDRADPAADKGNSLNGNGEELTVIPPPPYDGVSFACPEKNDVLPTPYNE